ncbi:hypothetical protein DXG01_001726 [Tephrocybe rancida]|nr:hypothetical protein DXG01_001726 [Tephrocybe rancida]
MALPATPSLFSPTLETIELQDVSTDHKIIRPFMYAMQQIAPELENFTIRGSSSSQTWQQILRFRQLRFLQLSGVFDLPSFREIAALPELRRLVLDMESSPPLLAHPPSDASTITFTQLRTLSISGNLFAIASYFAYMQGGHVTDLSIGSQAEQPPSQPQSAQQDQWALCLSVVATNWASTLRSLSLKTSKPETTSLPLTPDFNFSLSGLRLERLYLDGRVSALDCEKVAPSIWTVTDLRFHLVECSEKNSFRVLHALSKHCTNLMKLELGLGTYSTPESSGPVCSHTLKSLVIRSDDSYHLPNLQHVLGVAKSLHDLFPGLDVVHAKDGHGSAAFWKYVYEMIMTFQAVRKGI